MFTTLGEETAARQVKHIIHQLTHALLRKNCPGNRDEVFLWQTFPAR